MTLRAAPGQAHTAERAPPPWQWSLPPAGRWSLPPASSVTLSVASGGEVRVEGEAGTLSWGAEGWEGGAAECLPEGPGGALQWREGACGLRGPLAIQAGAAPVHVQRLDLDGTPLPPRLPLWQALVAGLIGIVVGGAAGSRWRGRGSVLLLLPGLVGGLVLAAGPAVLAGRLYLPPLLQPLAPFAVGACVLAGVVAARLAWTRAPLPGGALPAAALWPIAAIGLSWGPLSLAGRLVRGIAPGGGDLASAAALSGMGVGVAVLLGLLLRLQGADGRAAAGPATGVVGAGAIAVGAASLCGLWPFSAMALSAAATALLAAVLVENRNAERLRGFNPVSLLLMLLALGAGDQALRRTATAGGWQRALDGGARLFDDSRVQGQLADLELFETGQHTAYPDRGYPVAFPPRAADTRVVFLGGSATGGAFQNDDLDDFFPARVGRALGTRVQVVNQGVGGWTTFQIRHYLDRVGAELDADLLVLYVGYNDGEGGVPVTLPELAAARARQTAVAGWQRQSGLLRWAAVLRGSGGLSPGKLGPPLTDEQSREQLDAILGGSRARGERLLLVTEAALGHGTGTHRVRVLQQWATERDVPVLDGQAVLGACSRCFLDDVHLSDEGHERLAAAITERLRQLSWVPGGD